MKYLKRFISASAALVMLMQCGCAKKSIVVEQEEQTVITLSWWGNDSRTEYTLEAVQEFEQLHPDIKVKCSYGEWSGFEARNRIRMFSDTESDVMQINVSWLNEFSPEGTGYYDIKKLSDYIDLSNFPESYLKYGMRNGTLNAIPIAMNTETVYFNKTILDSYGLDVPQTWDDVFAAAKILSKDDKFILSGAAKAIWLYTIAYTEQTTGKAFYNDDGSLGFGEDELKIMIDFYGKLVNENVIPMVEDYKKNNLENGSYAGTVAWVSDAVNYFGNCIKDGNEIIATSYTSFSPDTAGEGWYEKPATLYAISKNTDHPKESAMLLDFLLNSREMALLQGVEKGIPISKSALKYLDKSNMLTGLQYEASEVMSNNIRLREMNPDIENTKMIDAFNNAANLVLFDKASSEEAAKQLMETFREISE